MGSKKTGEGLETVYASTAIWVDRALRADDSLFTPRRPIWSSQGLGELRRRFLDRPDEGEGGFYDKLKTQLEGSPPEVYQLMAEALYAQFLVIWKGGMGGETKKSQVEQVLSWGAPVSAIPNKLVDGLSPGIARSQALTQHRPYQVAFIIEFVEQWKEHASDERESWLHDPWAFKDFVTRVTFRSEFLRDHPDRPSAQREAVLHLVHPDTFEGTVSVKQKENIAKAGAFAHFIAEETQDVDRKLVQIRRGLETGLGKDLDFYDPNIRRRWNLSTSDPWDAYLRHASEYLDTGRLESWELNYKVEIGRKLADAREALLAGADDWGDLVKRGISGNIIHFIQQDNFRRWIDGSPHDAQRALLALWTRDASSLEDRVSAFCRLFPKSVTSGSGTRMNVISQLLMGLDVERYPPFSITTFSKAYARTGYDQPDQNADEVTLYEHALQFLDRFISEARTRELPVRHRLDAQSLVWIIPDHESETDRPNGRSENLHELAQELLLTEPSDFLEEIEALLYDKGQVIFQGPPGTGKTYVAQKLAEHLAGSEKRVTLVQLHPSYAYEDFVQGFRPTLKGGVAGFELRDGPLLRAAKLARKEEGEKHFLVIDEINRGNIAKVFGELYFLLEYRNQRLRLQYQRDDEEDFSLPPNLYIIGTMNTADRSIALVDLALRRRFYFVEFHPDDEPVKGVLRRWLQRKTPRMEWVADVVDRANEKLSDDRHAAIGPSYFMKSELNEATVERIWKHSVLPYIEERLFGEGDRLGEFDLDELRGSDGSDSTEDDGEVQEGSHEEGEENNANGDRDSQ